MAIGIVATQRQSTVFVCGGDTSYSEWTHWFAELGVLGSALSVSDDPWILNLEAGDDSVDGTVGKHGEAVRSFSARRVTSNTLAGVYDALGPCGHLGLVVRQESTGESPAAQGTCLKLVDGVVRVEQVNPVMPLTRDATAGIAVTVDSVPDQTFTLHPLLQAAD